MTPEEYLKQRVEDQIAWYDKRSQAEKRGFQLSRGIEIIGAAIIPFAAGFLPCGKAAAALLGIVVAVSAGFASLLQFQQNWIDYRRIAQKGADAFSNENRSV